MENLNLNLSLLELQYIKMAMDDSTSVSASHFEALRKIEQAIEACRAKEKADNDYAEKFYEGKDDTGAKVHYSCSVNLTLQHHGKG